MDSGEGGLENLVLVAKQKGQEFQEANIEAMNAAIEAHTTLMVNIKIDAPIIIIPKNASDTKTLGLVLDLGKFELHTSPQVEELKNDVNQTLPLIGWVGLIDVVFELFASNLAVSNLYIN